MVVRRRGTQARRHPERRASFTPAAAGPAHEPFERLVEQALESLPDEFRRLLEDVAIVIEDEETPDQRRAGRVRPRRRLYGLYQGVPATTYGADWAPFPNKITLFRLALEEDFPEPEAVREQVRRTVVHELAHHAGIDDDRLHILGFA